MSRHQSTWTYDLLDEWSFHDLLVGECSTHFELSYTQRAGHTWQRQAYCVCRLESPFLQCWDPTYEFYAKSSWKLLFPCLKWSATICDIVVRGQTAPVSLFHYKTRPPSRAHKMSILAHRHSTVHSHRSKHATQSTAIRLFNSIQHLHYFSSQNRNSKHRCV